MELNNIESLAVECAFADAKHAQIVELSDLQLALVGGGIGETVLKP